MRPLPRLARIAVILFGASLQGCLSTWVRLEDGTILPPGHSDFAVAYAIVPRVVETCPEPSQNWGGSKTRLCVHSEYNPVTHYPDGSLDYGGSVRYDTLPSELNRAFEPHVALVWRLGLLSAFGPFTGLDLAIQSEAATAPASQEFRLGLGLPVSDTLYAHELLAGWGIGLWADNSWFLQYAASRRFGRTRLFGSVRATRQATQGNDVFEDETLASNPDWDVQFSTGAKVRLGTVPVIPDWLLVGATLNTSHDGMPEMGRQQVSGWSLAATTAMGWTW